MESGALRGALWRETGHACSLDSALGRIYVL